MMEKNDKTMEMSTNSEIDWNKKEIITNVWNSVSNILEENFVLDEAKKQKLIEKVSNLEKNKWSDLLINSILTTAQAMEWAIFNEFGILLRDKNGNFDLNNELFLFPTRASKFPDFSDKDIQTIITLLKENNLQNSLWEVRYLFGQEWTSFDAVCVARNWLVLCNHKIKSLEDIVFFKYEKDIINNRNIQGLFSLEKLKKLKESFRIEEEYAEKSPEIRKNLLEFKNRWLEALNLFEKYFRERIMPFLDWDSEELSKYNRF